MISRICKLVLFAWVLGLGATAPAQAADSVILAADYWCPHTCDPATGRSGYMIDVASEAFALSGIKTIYQVRPWATSMADIRAGLIDGVVGVLTSEAPDLPHNHKALGRQSNAFVVQADDNFILRGLDSLAGKRIATVRDYSYSPEIDSWLAGHAAQIQSQPGNRAAESNLEHLLNDEVQVVVDDEAVLRNAIIHSGLSGKVRSAGRLPGGTLHIAFSATRSNGKELAAALDSGIEKLRESGRLAEILAGYGLADWE
ncbi:MAG: substrate-binding periplasmic protein [Magnetospirillum sp.]